MTRNQKIGAGVAAGAVLLYFYNRRPLVATVTTSEEYDLSSVGLFDAKIRSFAQAVANAEGWNVPNSIPRRANNPGNLKNGAPTLTGTSITQYESADQGWAALYRQLGLIVSGRSAHYDLGDTIATMAARYANEPGETAGGNRWAQNVASYLGVSTATPLWEVLT